jgi:predicted RNase H-like HicB family nuclease
VLREIVGNIAGCTEQTFMLIFQSRRGRIMEKYEIIIYWSNEDQIYVAEVPELPGCMAHGETQEHALKNVQEAIQLWIDTAKEFGDPIPEPKGRRFLLA